jgi:hypothetical protein
MNEIHNMRDFQSLSRLIDMLKDSRVIDGGIVLSDKNEIDIIAPKGGIMAEIGSFAGETMGLFGPLFNQVYAVDLWDDKAILGISSPEQPADIERRFDSAIKGHPNISKIKGDSAKSAEGFPDKYFDFVYIDACHEYEQALADIRAWMPKIRPNGVLAGHDYHPDYLGVIKAVQEVFCGQQNVVEYNWWVRL